MSFKNWKVSMKMVFGFGIAILLSIVLAIVGIYASTSIDQNYSYCLEYPQARMDMLGDAKFNISDMRRLVLSLETYVGDSVKVEQIKGDLDKQYNNIIASVNEYNSSVNTDPRLTQAERDSRHTLANELITNLGKYKSEIADKVYAEVLKGEINNIIPILVSGSEIITQMTNGISTMLDTAIHMVSNISDSNSKSAGTMTAVLIILAVASALISFIIAFLTARSITTPVKKLVSITNDVAKGQLNVNALAETKDEIGTLAKNFFIVINVVKSLVDDLSEMGRNHGEGEIESKVDENKYEGSFREVAAETNHMVFQHVNDILEFLEKVAALTNGDFKQTIKKLPGKKIIMHDSFEKVKKAITDINGEINVMIKNVADGKCSERIDVEKYNGDWVKMMDGLNNVLQNYNTPIDEMMAILGKLSQGNFKEQMTGTYKGDFNQIKTSVNGMIGNISVYINEISGVLNQLANNNLDQNISREYVGEFAGIKNAINNIIDKFNNVIGEITSATDQVAAGARQISESSMSLAQGATEQASSVEELTATVMSVNEKTQQNAEDSKRAADLTGELKEHATEGNNQMKNMLTSMKGITEASNNISKIINLIKDISFQTNLLALNASIEAAHAGVHGAGFSVVADEVRSLAVKSQEAANDTTELIETSIQRVNEGTSIAVKTDEALEKIVNGVAEVSGIVSGISNASNEQALAISQINDGVNQIAQVVQSNSATSEESASAAEELSSQSEMLRNMVKVFNLR